MPRRHSFAPGALALALCLACAISAGAEEPSSGDKAADAAAAEKDASSGRKPSAARPLEPGTARDAMVTELSTAGYYELVARARELGIDDKDGADEIRARLYAYYGLEAPAAASGGASAGKGRVVTIERAGEASFAKVEEEEGGIVVASGGVILSLAEENGDSHSIRADRIVYNRARSTMTARGSVYYERRSGGGTEIFTGESLSADLNDWSGVFLDGKVRKLGSSASSSSPSGSSAGERGLVVQADTILRRSADVMVLEKGVISSCDADDPHYAVKANRVWLLGDKEWAVADALFSLGNVPILWLPFFYYPGEELVFHPVIGYRSREGRFVQTTVYLIGSKPASTESSSMLGFQGSDDKPTKLKGLFLRRVSGSKPKDTGSLKTIFDLYSGLGGVAGLSGSFDKLGPLGKTSLYATGAMSRSLFLVSTGSYSPYVSAGDWASVWNDSEFLGLSLPFRYGLSFSTSYSLGGLSANLALPLYSDPYYEQDFTNRSEDMDWFSILKSSDSTDTTVSVRSQLLPTLSATFNPKMDWSSPWLSSLSLTKLTTYASFLTKSSSYSSLGESSTLFNYDPRRTFFYPSAFRPIDFALSLKGTLLSSQGASGQKKAGNDKGEGRTELELKSPWDEEGGAGGDAAAGTEAEAAATGAVPGAPSGTEPRARAAAGTEADALPGLSSLLKQPARAADPSAEKGQAWTGSLGWSLSPSAYYENRYRSDNWSRGSDIDYSLLYDLFSYKATGSLDAALGYGDYLSSTLSLSYTDQNQYRPYLFDDGTTSASTTAAAYKLADKLYQLRSLAESADITLKPLAFSWLWAASSLAWSLDSTIYNYSYSSTSSAFAESWLDWNASSITSHSVSATLAARPGGLTQSLSLVASLPPTLGSYSGKISFNAGVGSLSLQGRMYRASSGADFSYDPLTASLSIGASPWPVLSDTFVYDAFVDEEPDSNVASLAWGPFSVSLTSKQTYPYKPVVGSGWVSYGSETFDFTDLSLSLAPKLGGDYASSGGPVWSLSPSLSLSQSLVRFSESSLAFTLSSSFKLGDGFSFTVSSSSLNSVAWRYYAGIFDSQLSELGHSASSFQVNPLEDIWNSLEIWDESALRKSYFKLKSLSFKGERDLHDWTLSAEVSTAPLYDSSAKTYSLDTTFTILLKWKDLSDIKTKIVKTSSSSDGSSTLTY